MQMFLRVLALSCVISWTMQQDRQPIPIIISVAIAAWGLSLVEPKEKGVDK